MSAAIEKGNGPSFARLIFGTAQLRRRARWLMAWFFGAGLFFWSIQRVETSQVLATVRSFHWPELLVAAALVPLQVALAARRWQLIAARMSMPMTYSRAFAAYYASTIFNQLLPGGMFGDVWRVAGHAREEGSLFLGRAWYVGLLDRMFGFLALGPCIALGAVFWPWIATNDHGRLWLFAPALLWLVSLVLCVGPAVRWLPGTALWAKVTPEIHVLSSNTGGAWWWGFAPLRISIALVATLILQFACTSAALPDSQVEVLTWFKAWLAYPILLAAMVVPAGPGGFGSREAAAVYFLPQIGISAHDALALALLYGLSVFLGSVPALFLVIRQLAGAKQKRSSLSLRVVPDARRMALRGYLAWAIIHTILLIPRVLAHLERFSMFTRLRGGTLSLATYRTWLNRNDEDFWRIFGEVSLALTVLACVSIGGHRAYLAKTIRLFTVAIIFITFGYELNQLVGALLMNQEPLIYDELFLALHSVVLLSDLWTPTFAFGLILGAAAIFGLFRGIAWLVRDSEQSFARADKSALIPAALVLSLLLTSFVNRNWRDRRSEVQWSSLAIAANLETSWAAWKSIDDSIERARSAVATAKPALRRPNIALYVIESYGKIMADHQPLASPWLKQVHHAQRELGEHGWDMVSGYSLAPVSGGRSWLADGSVFLGQTIRYEAEFRHYLAALDTVPHLVGFLQGHGYETLRFAPSDRQRPGVETINDWGFDRMITFDELNYSGPKMGWGLVPDQWSLGYLHESLLPVLKRPYFSYFHMVSSHAPWQNIPPVLDDWHDLDLLPSSAEGTDQSANAAVLQAAWRFRRNGDARYAYAGKLNHRRTNNYGRAIAYDLAILFDHLREREDADIVIIMGDHQPPLLADYTTDFSVPVHVLCRDPELCARFGERGFVSGLIPDRRVPAIEHRDFFPILVEVLTK